MKNNASSSPAAKNGGARKIRNDIIFISVLLLSLVLIGFAFRFFGAEGSVVNVEVDGKAYGSYPLSRDVTVDIVTGEGNNEHNLLVIRDGKAFVESATCPDGICSAHRPISLDGECIICLPHRVIIEVKK